MKNNNVHHIHWPGGIYNHLAYKADELLLLSISNNLVVSIYQISISLPIISDPNGWNIIINKSIMITHCWCQIKQSRAAFFQRW